MEGLLPVLGVVLQTLRIVVFGTGAIVGVLALGSWLVRTRRLKPFSPAARFVRGTVDPLFAPAERRLVRSGGQPSHAPWWTLAAVVVGGIVLLSLVSFLVGQILATAAALRAGPSGIVFLVVRWTFAVLQIALLVRVASSWFRLSPYSPRVRWAFVLTEWFMAPLRRVVPSLGMIDITPIIAYFALSILEGVVLGALR